MTRGISSNKYVHWQRAGCCSCLGLFSLETLLEGGMLKHAVPELIQKQVEFN